jgi:hypothetical protein
LISLRWPDAGYMQHEASVWRAILLIVLMIMSGCQARQPDFLTRVHEDCAAGDRWACNLIGSLGRPSSADEHQNSE